MDTTLFLTTTPYCRRYGLWRRKKVLEDHERTPHIAYILYHKEQTKKFKQNPHLSVNWSYQELDATFCVLLDGK